MKRFPALLAPLAMIGALVACSPANNPGAVYFEGEAGAQLDEGGFGNPTMTNTLVQSGHYRLALANRFASEVESTVNFAFNSATLSPQAQAVLQRQATWIRQFPEVRFRVYGHTDLVGSQAYNRELGRRRAFAVVNYLSTLGISRSRLEAVVSYGETRPLIVTQGPERTNRRTVTEVIGFVGGGRPMGLNGKYAEVVFREYVESAVPESGLEASELGGSGAGGSGGG